MEEWKYLEKYDCYVHELGMVALIRKGIWKPLKGCYNKKGYLVVKFNQRQHLVSRLVLMACCGMPPKGMEASHLNGNKKDNRIENLKWETHVDNMQRKYEHGTVTMGEQHPFVKLTLKKAQEVWDKWNNGSTERGLGREYKVSRTLIRNITRGNAWPQINRA